MVVAGRLALLIGPRGAGYIAVLMVAGVAHAAEQPGLLGELVLAVEAQPVVVHVFLAVVLVAIEVGAHVEVQGVTLPVRLQQQGRRKGVDGVFDLAAALGIDVVVAHGPEGQLRKGAERAPRQPRKLALLGT